MPVGDDDTIASSLPASSLPSGSGTSGIAELVANRYRVVRWLGGGGMGRVYEVLDTELDERVALKVLRGGLAEDAIERFRREVRLTRRIQHRNVCRMFDIGEHAGDRFLTMELVDGEPLTRALGAGLTWARLHGLAIQLCEGLAAAHAQGVVHRDLKPDNVLVERATDRAVITDFGIARSLDDASVTQVGAIIGTPRYMAPEQLAGSELDARADLFSLGVMLFELATGARPWHGDNAITVAVAQATQPPRPFSSAYAPRWFGEVVMRCLALEPADRFASARELATTLAAGAIGSAVSSSAGRPVRVTLAPPTPTPTSLAAAPVPVETALAVLPLSCAPGDEYLADGVHEELIDTLSSTRLRVRPAGLVRTRGEPDLREVGRQLDVDHVVTGSVRRTPTGLRVSARLIGVADGFQIWAHRTECAPDAILQVADELARGIATALSTRATATVARPTDPRAVELYLRAKAELRRYWGHHAKVAADLLAEAVALAPDSAPITGTFAFASTQAWVMMGEPTLRALALDAIERALPLGHAEAYLASASYRLARGDCEGAASELGTALLRGPMVSPTHEVCGRILVEVAGTEVARRHFETAMALDPARTHIISMDLARIDALEGNWAAAEARIDAALQHDDAGLVQLASIFRARLAGWRGDRAAMVAAAPQLAQRMPTQTGMFIMFLSNTARTGVLERAVWQQFLAQFGGPDRPNRSQLMGLQVLTELSMLVGRVDLAYESLDAAEALGFMDLCALDRVPLFDDVRTDPTFVALRARVAARAARVRAAFEASAGTTPQPR